MKSVRGVFRLDGFDGLEDPARLALPVLLRDPGGPGLDHNVGFRQSDRYDEWKKMLHHFYDPFPIVEHYTEPLELETTHKPGH
jgi:hypothetical protein